MDREKIDDKYISQLVHSLEHDEPEMPDVNILKKERSGSNNQLIYLLRTIAATIILIIGIFLINNHRIITNKEFIAESDIKEISEIRTDFILREDNIKILWIQKKNFKLNKN